MFKKEVQNNFLTVFFFQDILKKNLPKKRNCIQCNRNVKIIKKKMG